MNDVAPPTKTRKVEPEANLTNRAAEPHGVICQNLKMQIASALICSAFIHHVDHAWSFAIRVGLATGIVTGIGATVNPYIEYYADNLPERRLGAFGIGLILCGFGGPALLTEEICIPVLRKRDV